MVSVLSYRESAIIYSLVLYYQSLSVVMLIKVQVIRGNTREKQKSIKESPWRKMRQLRMACAD